MKVSAITCPKCGAPSKLNGTDLLFMFERCETLHDIEENTSHMIEYEVVRPDNEDDRTQYLPVWKLKSEFTVNSSQSDGFWSSIYRTDDAGKRELNIFIPAWDTDPASFRSWAINLTTKKWNYRMGGRIGRHKRVPATVSRKQAYELADFVVVTIEAEKPGTMQYLDYSLKILDSSVVYIPQTI